MATTAQARRARGTAADLRAAGSALASNSGLLSRHREKGVAQPRPLELEGENRDAGVGQRVDEAGKLGGGLGHLGTSPIEVDGQRVRPIPDRRRVADARVSADRFDRAVALL